MQSDDHQTQRTSAKQQQGARSFQKGLSAELQVIRHYEKRGARLLHQRWRGRSGELDIVLHDGETHVIVEVKSSASHGRAADLLSDTQSQRIWKTAEEYLGTCPLGQLTPMRFDVALVDATGAIDILENALLSG